MIEILIEKILPLGGVDKVEVSDHEVVVIEGIGFIDSQVQNDKLEVQKLTQEVRDAHTCIHNDLDAVIEQVDSIEAFANTAVNAANTATQKADEASVSATEAKVAETNAEQAETNAKASEANATEQALIATDKATDAATSEQNAKASELTAEIHMNKAGEHSIAAESHKLQAAQHEANASGFADQANEHSQTASQHATTATQKAGEATASAARALTSEQNAKASEANATEQANVSTEQAVIATNKAVIASDKASEASVSEVNASDSEQRALEAAIRAENAAAAATGALSELGNADLSSGVPPTPSTDVNGNNSSCFWKVTGAGVINGIEYGVGDTIVYSANLDEYYKIDNTESVTSVNGKKGIVQLDHTHVGALPVGGTAVNASKLENTTKAQIIADARNGLATVEDSDNKYLNKNHDASINGYLAVKKDVVVTATDGNAHLYLKRSDNTKAGMLYFDNATQRIQVNRFNLAGTQTENYFSLWQDRSMVGKPLLQGTADQFAHNQAYTVKSYVDARSYTKAEADAKYLNKTTNGWVSGSLGVHNEVNVKAATANANAHFWLKRFDDTRAGLFYWDRNDDHIHLRRYGKDGTTAENELVLTPTYTQASKPIIQSGAQSTNSGAYTTKSYVDGRSWSKADSDNLYHAKTHGQLIEDFAGVGPHTAGWTNKAISMSDSKNTPDNLCTRVSFRYAQHRHFELSANKTGSLWLRAANADETFTPWYQVFTTHHLPAISEVSGLQAALDTKLGKTETAANSSKLNGFGLTENATANTVVKRNSSGDVLARLHRSTYANQATISGAMAFRVNSGSDNFIRFCSDQAAIRTWLGVHGKNDVIDYGRI